MNQKNEHIDSKPLLPKHEELFTAMEVPFKKSKEDMWDELSAKIDLDAPSKPKAKQRFLNWQQWAIAAAVLVTIISTTLVFNTTEVTSLNGEQLTHSLPDGSKIYLNAGSVIRYNPYLWNWKREVSLSGEAFFEVQKGERFAVISEQGATEVLGTSFNIFARKAEYEVFCKTGKVKVYDVTNNSETIIPGQKVTLNKQHKLVRTNDINSEDVLFWREGKLKFISRKLPLVLEELERQYDASIQLKSEGINQLTYTGYFARDKNLDSVLEMMALSLNLKLKKTANQQYLLSQ